MKRNIFLSCLFIVFTFLYIGTAFAEWKALLNITGQNIGGQYKNNIIIGLDSEAQRIPAPPSSPDFTCNMNIKSSDWRSSYIKDIRVEGYSEYKWVIAINPHGNLGPPIDATSTLTWNPEELGQGRFELRQGWDGTGDIIVSDMSTVSKIDITGKNADQYFTLILK